MKPLFAVLAALCLSPMLSGCITAATRDFTPDQKVELVREFLKRCGGTVSVGANGSVGQLGGAASADYRLIGNCPAPGEVPAEQAPKP